MQNAVKHKIRVDIMSKWCNIAGLVAGVSRDKVKYLGQLAGMPKKRPPSLQAFHSHMSYLGQGRLEGYHRVRIAMHVICKSDGM